ncbi:MULTISPECIES: HprK-related kinase B [unclassified Pseudodesulfovibrio]|uniref:HprK-related kinase B n=1 Tax=unclassified Pseudodesulfovibrio TaxID=2661612 RepID=UPI000FEBD68D|nr:MULTISPECIES: HprK-related kinase B [unclassified Pseudodesulfovibrio]MCJ2164398.1 HprK-related kinase B [Pseudodesulfovibrio sp. S3-i]RWU04605.1 HprK-related kinase B [Pseudodesulfovibrio sp. S3]
MKLTGTTRKELAAEIKEAAPATRELLLHFGGCIIQANSSSDELHAALAGYFKEFVTEQGIPEIVISAHETPSPEMRLDFNVKQPDSGKTRIKEEWADLPDGRVVRKRLTGMHFLFGQGENVAVGPCLDNSNQVINFINNRFIEWKLNRGGFLGHAAGVIHNGRGISLAGFSGAGKSTLALHLMSKGTTFVSNDRIMVEENGDGLTMYGVAKQPRINPGTALHNPDLNGIVEPDLRDEFLDMPSDKLWQLEHKYDALIDECYGPGKFELRSPMNALVILNWTRSGGPMRTAMVDPMKRKDLLPAFMKSTGLFYLPENQDRQCDPDMDAYAKLLQKTDLVEISGGVDFEQASDICLKYMETGELVS